MKIKKEDKIKYILVASWIALLLFGFFLLRRGKVKILEDETVDYIPNFQDNANYNFSVEATVEEEYSPLYQCRSNKIPEYLNDLAMEIDPNLTRVESSNFVKWVKDGSEDILVYNIDNTYLNIYLDSYTERVNFTSVENFISKYLTTSLKYYEIEVQVEGDTEIHTANRVIGEEELITGYGYSDYYYVENGYLSSARILLAEISEIEFSVPLVKNRRAIEAYINLKGYPKDVIVHTSEIIQLTQYNYEVDFQPEFKYEKCIVNDIEPKLYFSSCNQNFIYYSYKIEGTCDVIYEEELYTVPFQGFMNAVEPEYVKSVE